MIHPLTTALAVPPGGALPPHDALGADEALWSAWSVDPQLLVPVAIAVALYLRGLTRWRERSRAHSRWRTASYLSGIALLVLAVESPIDRLGEHHLTFHMIQHEIVMMWAVPLILLGAPTTPSLRGLPRQIRLGVVRPLARRGAVRWGYRALTHPAVAVGVLAATLWAWHLAPGWYDAALDHAPVHDLQHVSFAAAASLLWWNVIDPKPLRSRIPHLPRMLYVFAAGVPKHFLGALIVFADEPLYATYAAARPIVSLTPIEDQQLGGLIMWVPSVMMHLAAMAIVFAVWARQSEVRQRALDAELMRVRAEAAERARGAP